MKSLIIKSLVALAAAFVLLVPAPALAWNPFGKVDCTKASNSAVCSTPSGKDPIIGVNGVIHKATIIVSIFGGVAAVIVLVLSGIRYITSNGEAEQIAKAKRGIIFSIVGLLVIAFAQTIIYWVISGI